MSGWKLLRGLCALQKVGETGEKTKMNILDLILIILIISSIYEFWIIIGLIISQIIESQTITEEHKRRIEK